MMRVHVTVVQALELFQKSLLKLYGHPDEDVAKANWKYIFAETLQSSRCWFCNP